MSEPHDTDSGPDVGADRLDALLRDAARREAYIDDGGFTAALMGRLPARADSALRRRILLGSALIATAFGLLAFGGAAYIWQAVLDLVLLRGFGPAQAGVLVFALLFYWSLYTAVGAETE